MKKTKQTSARHKTQKLLCVLWFRYDCVILCEYLKYNIFFRNRNIARCACVAMNGAVRTYTYSTEYVSKRHKHTLADRVLLRKMLEFNDNKRRQIENQAKNNNNTPSYRERAHLGKCFGTDTHTLSRFILFETKLSIFFVCFLFDVVVTLFFFFFCYYCYFFFLFNSFCFCANLHIHIYRCFPSFASRWWRREEKKAVENES